MSPPPHAPRNHADGPSEFMAKAHARFAKAKKSRNHEVGEKNMKTNCAGAISFPSLRKEKKKIAECVWTQ